VAEVSDAVVAERARFRHFERTECLAVATRTRSEPDERNLFALPLTRDAPAGALSGKIDH